MDTPLTVVLILAVVIIGLVVTLIVVKGQRHKARLAAMTPAERELHDAEREHAEAVKNAEKAVSVAERSYARGVKQAERKLNAAKKIGHSESLADFKGKDGRVLLTPLTITVSGKKYDVTEDARAEVDTAGNLSTKSRSTLTRIGAGAVLFGPVGAVVGATAKKSKDVDKRELYLLVEGDGFAGVISCDPDDGAKARDMAQKINLAARNAAKVRQERDVAIESAERELHEVRAHVEPVEQAKRELSAAQKEAPRLISAREALGASEKPVNE